MKSFKNDSTWYLIKFTQVYKIKSYEKYENFRIIA